MEGEVAECQVPSATVTGPIVQVYEFEGKKRLVVALPNLKPFSCHKNG